MTLTCWHMQGEYIFTLTQLIVVDRVRVILALQTEKFLIIVQTPQVHIHSCLKYKNGLGCHQRCSVLTKHTVFQSIKTTILNIGRLVAYLE